MMKEKVLYEMAVAVIAFACARQLFSRKIFQIQVLPLRPLRLKKQQVL
jgi:hypothetical protein